MKQALLCTFCICLLVISLPLTAQEPAKKSKAVKTAETANQKSREISEASGQIMNESQQVASNVQQTVANAKAVVKIFEPILRFRLKKKAASESPVASAEAPVAAQQEQAAGSGEQTATTQSDMQATYVTPSDIASGTEIIAESAAYNTDGTANLGSQNNKKFGCYIDMMRGAILDEVDAAGQSKSIDLIFTATNAFNEQVPMYAFLTPSYVKNDAFAYNFFKGVNYKDRNIPPASWEEVNESEVAMTALTGDKFEKIQNNNQLMAVIKQVRGFGQKVESRTKLDGKVIAVKTEMGDRTAYGLLYIMNHYGTTGENGYLKVKIKVTGFDATGDGNPDASMYQTSF